MRLSGCRFNNLGEGNFVSKLYEHGFNENVGGSISVKLLKLLRQQTTLTDMQNEVDDWKVEDLIDN